MLALSLTALTSVLIALANSAAALPLESHPTLTKRAPGSTIGFNGLCVGVESLADGARVATKDCNDFNAGSNPPFYNRWEIASGNNDGVKLVGLPAGSNDFCLDSGDLNGDFSNDAAKIWSCFSGNPNQQWVNGLLICIVYG